MKYFSVQGAFRYAFCMSGAVTSKSLRDAYILIYSLDTTSAYVDVSGLGTLSSQATYLAFIVQSIFLIKDKLPFIARQGMLSVI